MDMTVLLSEMSESTYDSRVKHFTKEVRVLNLPRSIKATRWLLDEMTAEKGYKRHNGSDYFVHPVQVAQTALDFKLIAGLIDRDEREKADILLSTCLLHDIVEDIPEISLDNIREGFGIDISKTVDNLTKRLSETPVEYIKRVSCNEISSVVKILDRLHNVTTLSESSLKHREKQLKETREVYLPLTKIYRRDYWEYGDFFFQARLIITSILNEIDRAVKYEKIVEKT